MSCSIIPCHTALSLVFTAAYSVTLTLRCLHLGTSKLNEFQEGAHPFIYVLQVTWTHLSSHRAHRADRAHVRTDQARTAGTHRHTPSYTVAR